jgi:hypothetical protein
MASLPMLTPTNNASFLDYPHSKATRTGRLRSTPTRIRQQWLKTPCPWRACSRILQMPEPGRPIKPSSTWTIHLTDCLQFPSCQNRSLRPRHPHRQKYMSTFNRQESPDSQYLSHPMQPRPTRISPPYDDQMLSGTSGRTFHCGCARSGLVAALFVVMLFVP